MFATFSDRSADGLWRQLHSAVRNTENTQSNPCRGGSQELLHVALSISDPRLRWVLSRTPAINPAFALVEVVWIIRGRSDASFLVPWNSRLQRFAGSAEFLHGAYGHRLRKAFGFDQLERAAEVLASQPGHRQVVLQVWDSHQDAPHADGTPTDRDIPCNTGAFLKIAEGRLDWLQFVRSNDIMLGLPYNLIQWTTIHEVIAGWIGVPLGQYHQISDSLHLYDRDRETFGCAVGAGGVPEVTSLAQGIDESRRIFSALEALILWLNSMQGLPENPEDLITDELPSPYSDWQRVLLAEAVRRRLRPGDADSFANTITEPQLRIAMQHWIARVQEEL